MANTKRRQRRKVSWYGGGWRQVAVVTGTGHWHKSGEGLVLVRWVFVQDLTGTHRDEYFFTTNVDLTPTQIIEADMGRWAIEVTFEELREHVGLETTRGRCAPTILRAEPCPFGLSTLVAGINPVARRPSINHRPFRTAANARADLPGRLAHSPVIPAPDSS